MKKNIISLLVKLTAGLAVVAGIRWLVKCGCVNLSDLTPASIRNYIHGFGRLAAFVYIIAYVLNTISIVPPIAPLSLTAGLAFGEVRGALFLMTGAMTGTTITFIISRFFGRGLIEKILKGKFRNLDEKLEKNGFMTVLFFRVVPLVPYEVLNYACGLSKIKFKDYLSATFLGLVPGVAVSAFFGGSLGEIKTFKDILAPKFLIAIGLMAVILAVPAVYRVIKKKREDKVSGLFRRRPLDSTRGKQ